MPRFTLTTLATLALVSFAPRFSSVQATSCVSFDSDFNLYVFGLNGGDYNLGAQTSWTSAKATALTSTGRPPFDGENTLCYLSQFNNAIYVIDGDKANPSDIHLYDAAAKSWTTQKTTGAIDPTSLSAILDHDTNVFFALSNGTLYSADFSTQKAANSTPIDWEVVGNPSFTTTGYSPVMALAQNHIHFLNVPGLSAGQADIFVIHFAYFQPEVQTYPASSGNTFPAAHGQATSFFMAEGVQQQFAFIPDDGSATYVINVENNSTTPLAGPSDKSAGATYAASTSALIQLSSSGALSFLPFDGSSSGSSSNLNAKWSTINVSGLPSGGGSSGSGSSTSGITTKTGSATSATKTGSSTGSASGSAASSTGTSNAAGARFASPIGSLREVVFAAVLGAVSFGMLLSF